MITIESLRAGLPRRALAGRRRRRGVRAHRREPRSGGLDLACAIATTCAREAARVGGGRSTSGCRSGASPSRSRTTSTSPARRPPPPVRPFAYRPARDATVVARLPRRRRAADRQDQSRPVRHRPRRRALALRHAALRVRPRLRLRRLELRARRSRSRAGWSRFALGTDTAGSGRVPAAFNNLVGVKPTRGLISTARRRPGLPLARLRQRLRRERRRRRPRAARRTGVDARDAYSRPMHARAAAGSRAGDRRARRARSRLLRRRRGRRALRARRRAPRRRSAGETREIDYAPFRDTAHCSTTGPGSPSATRRSRRRWRGTATRSTPTVRATRGARARR